MRKYRKVVWLSAYLLCVGAACGSSSKTTGSTTAPTSLSASTAAVTAVATTIAAATTTTAATTSAAGATTTTKPPGCPGASTDPIEHNGVWYRQCEVIADGNAKKWLADNNFNPQLVYDLSEGSTDTAVPVQLYSIADDSLSAVSKALAKDVLFVPNYVMFGSPGWTYGPYGDPDPMPKPTLVSANTSGKTITVGVIDSGFDISAAATAQDGSSDLFKGIANLNEIVTGHAAGHGTFIAGLIRRLEPSANVVPAQVLFADPATDKAFKIADNVEVWISDDVRVARTAQTLLKATPPLVLNLSLGTPGGTAGYPPPPALYRVLSAWQVKHSDFQVVAAAGNVKPEERANPPLPFYPGSFSLKSCDPTLWTIKDSQNKTAWCPGSAACSVVNPDATANSQNKTAWCPGSATPNSENFNRWISDVGSNPKADANNVSKDYTNWGPWVTTVAKGSDVVSWRPIQGQDPTDKTKTTYWYQWSGTSFAAACMSGRLARGETPAFQNSTSPTNPQSCDPATFK
jgi:Subtilase family